MCGYDREPNNNTYRGSYSKQKEGSVKLFFLPDQGEGPASMYLPRKLKSSSLPKALEEIKEMTDCESGIICKQIAP